MNGLVPLTLTAARKSLPGVSVTAAMLFAVASAFGQSAPHVHGTGTLNLAIEGNTLILELVAPASDIVGFEHPPASSNDRQAVLNAAQTLKDGELLFRLPNEAGCDLKEAEVETGLLQGDDHSHSEPDEDHAEFHAHYRFQCSDPDELHYIDVDYFSKFPNAHELETRTITPAGQNAAELTPHASRLKL